MDWIVLPSFPALAATFPASTGMLTFNKNRIAPSLSGVLVLGRDFAVEAPNQTARAASRSRRAAAAPRRPWAGRPALLVPGIGPKCAPFVPVRRTPRGTVPP